MIYICKGVCIYVSIHTNVTIMPTNMLQMYGGLCMYDRILMNITIML
jgi:hypothetical protein